MTVPTLPKAIDDRGGGLAKVNGRQAHADQCHPQDVKKRWGSGQEDVFPVTQFEKLWSDMTRLDELDCRRLLG